MKWNYNRDQLHQSGSHLKNAGVDGCSDIVIYYFLFLDHSRQNNPKQRLGDDLTFAGIRKTKTRLNLFFSNFTLERNDTSMGLFIVRIQLDRSLVLGKSCLGVSLPIKSDRQRKMCIR